MTFNDARFNQDGSCICVANDRGFKILNTNPMVITCDRDLRSKQVGSIGTAEMLYRTNLVALVGNSEYYDIRNIGTKSLRNRFIKPWKQNILTIWDDKKLVEVAQLVFTDSILNVKLLYDMLVVVLNYKVYIYQMSDVTLVDCSNTMYNPFGISSVASSRNLNLIAHPGKLRGTVVVHIFSKNRRVQALETLHSIDETDDDEYKLDKRKRRINGNGLANMDVFQFNDVLKSGEEAGKYSKTTLKMHVHTSEITTVNFSANGLLFVTSSLHGRFIKLFDTLSGELIQVFLKCNNFGRVTRCCFDKEMKWLAVITDKPKLYLYQIDQIAVAECEIGNENRRINFEKSCIFDINSESSDVGRYFKHYKNSLIHPLSRCGDNNLCRNVLKTTLLYINSTSFSSSFKPRKRDKIIDCSLLLEKETIIIILQTGKALKLFFNPRKPSSLSTGFYHFL